MKKMEDEVCLSCTIKDRRKVAAGYSYGSDGLQLCNGQQPFTVEECSAASVRSLVKEKIRKYAEPPSYSAPQHAPGINKTDPPPTPNTNRRILYNLAVAANVTPTRTEKLKDRIQFEEGFKTKDLYDTNCMVLGKGKIIALGPGKRPPTIDECSKSTIHKVLKEFVSELPKAEKAAAEAAGVIQTPPRTPGNDQPGSINGPASAGSENAVANPTAVNKSASPAAGNKRPIEDISECDGEDEIDEFDTDNDQLTYEWTCNEVRTKIRSFLDSGEMKVTEFLKTIHCNPGSYHNFMKLKSPWSGIDNQCMAGAYRFFKRRERAGIKMPKKPRTAKAAPATVELGDIELEGEDDDAVPVYDTCGEIRRKIAAHLRKPDVVQAQFLRDLAAQFHTEDVTIRTNQLSEFRKKKGPDAGNTSRVYYAAYVFFEKLRIKNKKPKSKHREEMESIYFPGGVDRTVASGNRYIIARAGESVWKDKYGRVGVGSGPM